MYVLKHHRTDASLVTRCASLRAHAPAAGFLLCVTVLVLAGCGNNEPDKAAVQAQS